MKPTLTPKQATFVEEFLVDSNGTQAAIRAGYSPRTANEQAARLLANASVADAVAAARQLRAERVQVEADDVLRQVAHMLFVDVRRLVDDQSRPIPLHLLPDDVAAAIQSVEITDHAHGRTFRYRLADRVAAVDKLMRHLGLFSLDNRQAGNAIGELLAAIHGAGSRLPITPKLDARRRGTLPHSQHSTRS